MKTESILLLVIFVFFLIYVGYVNLVLKSDIVREYKIVTTSFSNIKTDTLKEGNLVLILQDSLKSLKYELDITKKDVEKIEEVNDKRFELLGWGLSLIITIIALFFALNYTISKSMVRDTVYEQMDEKYKDYKKRYEALIKESEELSKKIKEKTENL